MEKKFKKFIESDFALYHAKEIVKAKGILFDKDAKIDELPIWEEEIEGKKVMGDNDILLAFIDWLALGQLLAQLDQIFDTDEVEEIKSFIQAPKTSRVIPTFINEDDPKHRAKMIEDHGILALFEG